MIKVRTRYAPSPTGIPHIGNIRTALYNFLFAKNQKGEFLLRIEDTDQKRLIPSSIPKIKESLKILNLQWDQIYVQSKRLSLYQKSLDLLKKKNLVYKEDNAWRFKVPKNKKISWQDLVHGQVDFVTNVIEDFVIIKSDGFPTYHFASVIDDHDMGITHVIRGDEWISSSPKHLLLYEAFSWAPPKLVHLPPILGSNHKKLSKREGAKSVIEYIEDGYLADALINFLALLGWAPKGDQELFTLDNLIKEFSHDRLNKNSPIFNLEKLNWFNRKYLQKYSLQDLSKMIKKFSKLAQNIEEQKLVKIVDLTRDRLVTLSDFDNVAKIFFEKGKQALPPKEKIQSAKTAIQSIGKWDEQLIIKGLESWISQNNLDPADFKNTLRLSVFADNTPPIYQSLATLSREQVLSRIDDAIKKSK